MAIGNDKPRNLGNFQQIEHISMGRPLIRAHFKAPLFDGLRRRNTRSTRDITKIQSGGKRPEISRQPPLR